ncbi:MAG: hypothetical protein AAF682_15725 [Planctomycetota bacterium]
MTRERRRGAEREVAELLAAARQQAALRPPETAEQARERRAALAALGRDGRREERRRRAGWIAAAAAVLAVGTLVFLRSADGADQGRHDTLARSVGLASFPREPFALDFERASRPAGPGSDLPDPLRSAPAGGPRIVAPLGSIVERRPEVRFERGGLPDAGVGSLAVVLTDTSGREVVAEVLGCDVVCRARVVEELSAGEWIASVGIRGADVDWSDRVRFEVRPPGAVEALLAELEPTGDARLDHLVAAARLVDAGFAAPALGELAKATSLTGRSRARAVLIAARAARILRDEARLDELRSEWLALRAAHG